MSPRSFTHGLQDERWLLLPALPFPPQMLRSNQVSLHHCLNTELFPGLDYFYLKLLTLCKKKKIWLEPLKPVNSLKSQMFELYQPQYFITTLVPHTNSFASILCSSERLRACSQTSLDKQAQHPRFSGWLLMLKTEGIFSCLFSNLNLSTFSI